jgi:hypothetical protein
MSSNNLEICLIPFHGRAHQAVVVILKELNETHTLMLQPKLQSVV